jgi:hypothetical protein
MPFRARWKCLACKRTIKTPRATLSRPRTLDYPGMLLGRPCCAGLGQRRDGVSQDLLRFGPTSIRRYTRRSLIQSSMVWRDIRRSECRTRLACRRDLQRDWACLPPSFSRSFPVRPFAPSTLRRGRAFPWMHLRQDCARNMELRLGNFSCNMT